MILCNSQILCNRSNFCGGLNVQAFFAGWPSVKSYWLAQHNDELNLS